jgi:glycosyltransferase involved in cell wall biosynthesis
VISSNISSLPEVVGDAGILIDPYNVRALANAIEAIDGDPALAARLVGAGQAQIDKFSDAAYRGRLSALYDRIMDEPA